MKNLKVVVLEDEPRFSKEIVAVLESSGCKVVFPTDENNAIAEIKNGAALIFHFANKTETYSQLCEILAYEFPQIPVIHISASTNKYVCKSQFRGALQRRIRPLAPKKEILKTISRLLYFGRLLIENRLRKQWAKWQTHLNRAFLAVEPDSFKSLICQIFKRELKADEVYYLDSDAEKFYLEELWKVNPITAVDKMQWNTKCAFNSKDQVNPEELSATLNQLADENGNEWKSCVEPIMISNGNAPSFIVLPFISAKDGKSQGRIIVVNSRSHWNLPKKNLLKYVTSQLGRHLDLISKIIASRKLSFIDDVTSLYNQRYMRIIVEKEIARAKRENNTFSLLFMDIDHFKKVNDSSGHLVGSQILKEMSDLIKGAIRNTDYAFRYGGDEFIVLLIGTNQDGAKQVAERIRSETENRVFDPEGIRLKLTISIGISNFPDHALTPDKIIELADQAMYAGKNKSRNVVYIAS